MRKSVAGIAAFMIAGLFSGLFAAAGRAAPPPTRLCVVAVHESSLFTLCPPELQAAIVSGDFRRLFTPFGFSRNNFEFKRYRIWVKPYGMLNISFNHDTSAAITNSSMSVPPPFLPEAAGILERSRPDWQGLAMMGIGVCPSGWVDSRMRKEIEAEFDDEKQNYELVDFPEQADVVLLAEGLYETYWNPDGTGRMQYHHDGESFFPERQLRKAAIAVLVPSAIYRRDPVDREALLRSSLWAGVSVMKGGSLLAYKGGVDPYLSTRSASVKELMSQFFRRAQWNADIPPICPAWSVRSKSAPDTASGKGAPIAPDSGQNPSL